MDKYNHKNCQSLFGYAYHVHMRSGGICQYCGCGGNDEIDFDIWRQMTVEHIIGSSQKGYRKDIKALLIEKYPSLSLENIDLYTSLIDSENTITSCSFCNSTTSRVQNPVSMENIILEGSEDPKELIAQVTKILRDIFNEKKIKVQWKLESVREVFEGKVKPELESSRSKI